MLKLINTFLFTVLFFAATAQESITSYVIKASADSAKAHQLDQIMVGWSDGFITNYYTHTTGNNDQIPVINKYSFFEAGSITKTFTAYILTKLLEERKISDSTPLVKYLPDSVKSNTKLSGILLRDVLNHTSGLPRMPLYIPKDVKQPYKDLGWEHIFTNLKSLTPQPKGKYEYSNLGYALLGYVAEQISGESYSTLLFHQVFRPLGLSDSIAVKRYISGYFSKNTPQDYWQFKSMGSAGGLVANAREIMGYLVDLSNPASKTELPFLNRFLAPTFTLSPNMQIAKGWHISKLANGKEIYWHNGGTYGFSTFAAFERGTRKAVLVVVNRFNKNAVSDGLGVEIMKKMMEK